METLFTYNNMGSSDYKKDDLFKGEITFTYNTIMVGGIHPNYSGGAKDKKIDDSELTEFELCYYMATRMEN